MLLFLSCEKYHINTVYRSRVLPQIGRHTRDSSASEDKPAVADTTIYISAVNVPGNYDWRRDTSYGRVACELLFIKDGERLFSLGTGPGTCLSAAPETHHIMNGHLYTEYNTPGETVICRDGEEVLRYPGREVLKGLLLSGGKLHTLGHDKDGNQLVYRCDGELQFRQEDATVFGDFSSLSTHTGALYDDLGQICFCFKTGSSCFKVADGTVSQLNMSVSATRVADLVTFLGRPYYIGDYTNSVIVFTPSRNITLPTGTKWKDMRLFFRDSDLCIMASNDQGCTICCRVDDIGQAMDTGGFTGGNLFVYPFARSACAVSYERGNLKVQGADGEYLFIRDSSFFFGAGCACMAGESMFVAVTPREAELSPFVWHGGKESPFALDGYITGIDVEISPPS